MKYKFRILLNYCVDYNIRLGWGFDFIVDNGMYWLGEYISWKKWVKIMVYLEKIV